MEKRGSFTPPVDIRSHTGPQPFRFHSREALWLIACQDGQAEYRQNGRSVPLSVGDILLLPPGSTHGELVPLPGGRTHRHIAVFVGATAVRLFDEMENYTTPREVVQQGYFLLHTTGTQWEYLILLAEHIAQEAQPQQFGQASILYGRVFMLLGFLGRSLQEKYDVSHGQADLLEQILRYVDLNLRQKITLADTAHRFLVSESTICKLFRSRMNNSFYHYVIHRRLLAAQQLIAAGVPLEQIYSQVGFCDHAAFYRAFRQAFGRSPRQYRQEVTWDIAE